MIMLSMQIKTPAMFYSDYFREQQTVYRVDDEKIKEKSKRNVRVSTKKIYWLPFSFSFRLLRVSVQRKKLIMWLSKKVGEKKMDHETLMKNFMS